MGNKQSLLSRSKTISLLRDILIVLPASDKLKIWIVVGAQMFLSFLDLAGIAVIGVLGALAVTGAESGTPGNRVSAVLRLLHLSNYSFQVQLMILGLTATALLVVRTFSSIFLTKRILLFMSRRAALITSQLVTNLFSRSILDLQKYTQQEVLFSVTTGVQNLTLGVIGTGITVISDLSLLLVLAFGLLVVDPWMAIFIILSLSTIGYNLYRFMRHRAHVIGRDEVELGIASNQKIIEFLDTYREAIVKNRRRSYVDEISILRYKLADVVAEKAFMPNISKYMVETMVVIGALAIGGIQFTLQDATHAVASLSVFLAAGTRIAPAVLRIQQGAVTIRYSLVYSLVTLGMIH
jgi:ABC-type multidrug transport system fused ATPase/permease subunit